MKVKQAAKVAVRWSGGDKDRAIEIFMTQVELDPVLAAQFMEEAKRN